MFRTYHAMNWSLEWSLQRAVQRRLRNPSCNREGMQLANGIQVLYNYISWQNKLISGLLLMKAVMGFIISGVYQSWECTNIRYRSNWKGIFIMTAPAVTFFFNFEPIEASTTNFKVRVNLSHFYGYDLVYFRLNTQYFYIRQDIVTRII